ncbi:SGNH/GDSL hydrolase family protein [Kineothrix sp. MB12-C1]|uniref:SGNH/GDSL hydrolase family protein n=1 Tax=Kineothrix sp. MB12-C1 TaxID=3070215 RepID=UPI0027D22944|nr:SGNH/GDSL hydrolase family protein [Kineothrix sp. MB12-C1]WMC93392.1 SGNH/GDSL hydrolase family protein [Kineothrix sp. MB12-C1]
MRQILCFGDSNTFGSIPGGGRYPREIRWPGQLQSLLDDDFYVIEEGMGGRTTVWDDPTEPYRSGIRALPISLHTHSPLSLIVLSLGTNDCKSYINVSPAAIAKGIEHLCKTVQQFDYGVKYSKPDILLVSPIHIGEGVADNPLSIFDELSVRKSQALAPLYRTIADNLGCFFLDASKVSQASSIDKLHMDEEGHTCLAEAIYESVSVIFGTKI